MNITCNSKALANELRLLDKIASTKPTIPILMNVLLRAEDRLRLSATDLEVGLTTVCPATILEQGTATLPVNRLLSLVDQLPDTDVRLTMEGTKVQLSSGTFRSKLQTWPADDFPLLPDVEGNVSSLDGSALKALIDKTRFAITDKSQMYVIDGAQLSLTGNTAAMVATDGKRLSVATTSWTGEPLTVLLPTKTIDVLLSQELGGTIEVCRTEKHIFFVMGERVLLSRMLESKFPAYARIIPKDHEHVAILERKVLSAILKRIGVVSEKTQAVFITATPGLLTVSARNVEVGEAEEQMPVQYGGPEIRVSVNWKYVADFLEAAVGQTVSMALKNDTSPLLMTDGTDFLNVILGIRV